MAAETEDLARLAEALEALRREVARLGERVAASISLRKTISTAPSAPMTATSAVGQA